MSTPATITDHRLAWAGSLPSTWDVQPLRYLLSALIAGGTPDTSDPDLWTDDGGFAWVAISDMTKQAVVTATDKRVTETAIQQKRLQVLPHGTLLYSIYATLGKVAVLGVPAVTNQAILALLPNRKLHRDFLRWWLTAFEPHVAALSNGNTQDNLNASKVRSLPVALPPLPLQRRIADFLDRKTAAIDDLIAKKERLAHLLQEKRQAVITQAVTKGLDPNVKMKESGIDAIGSIPSHWQLSQLMHLTAPTRPIMYGIVLPGPHVADGIPIVKSGDCRPERLRLDLLNRTTPEIEAPYARARLEPGDIVYAIRGSIGMAALVPKELRGANLTQDAARIAPRKGVNNQWLLFAVQSDAAWAQLEPGIVGATVKGINIRDLKRPWIPVPPPNEQHAIALELRTRIGTLTRTESATKTSIAKLREYRQTLITAAVTGKLDVTTHERTIDDTLTALEASG